LWRSATRPKNWLRRGQTTALGAPATGLGDLTSAPGERMAALGASDLRPPLHCGEGAKSKRGLPGSALENRGYLKEYTGVTVECWRKCEGVLFLGNR